MNEEYESLKLKFSQGYLFYIISVSPLFHKYLYIVLHKVVKCISVSHLNENNIQNFKCKNLFK